MNTNIAVADQVIKEYSVFAMGLGIIPVPMVDFFGVMVVQIDLTRRLCEVYEKTYDESETKTLLSALASTSFTRLTSSLVKAIPVVGAVLGGATTAVLSGASTYASGEVLKRHFELGGSLLNLDINKYKDYYTEQFQIGKQKVINWRRNTNRTMDKVEEIIKEQTTSSNDSTPKQKSNMDVVDLSAATLEELRQLNQLHVTGVVNDTEFQAMKKKIIASEN